MNTKRMTSIAVIAVALAAVAGPGCQSTRKTTQVPPIGMETQEVAFPKELDYAREMKVNDKNDPSQIVNFALSLSQRGRHVQAAEFLNDAANRFVSRDNEFGVACRAAAANEYLLANDVNSFRTTTAQLRREMNRFQLAGADDPIATVLSLGDIASGVDRPSSMTPKQLRELYQSARKTTPSRIQE